jgi:hypothetical protein
MCRYRGKISIDVLGNSYVKVKTNSDWLTALCSGHDPLGDRGDGFRLKSREKNFWIFHCTVSMKGERPRCETMQRQDGNDNNRIMMEDAMIGGVSLGLVVAFALFLVITASVATVEEIPFIEGGWRVPLEGGRKG